VGDLTHAVETLLEKPIRDQAKTGPLITALEASFDQLHKLVQQVSQGQATDYPQAMIDQLLAWPAKRRLPTMRYGDCRCRCRMQEQCRRCRFRRRRIVMPRISSLPELLPEMEEEVRSSQEQIRVRADLLDSLVNHAGEVAIYRSRLEQQVAGYRFNLVEFEQTVSRLRSQLRMLEIETEAQIIARFQREHREAGLTVFDPLELDRYSQLQQYSRALAESVSDLVSIQNMLDELTRQAETLLIQQSRVSTELQDGLLRTRMLPFDTMVPNLRRTCVRRRRSRARARSCMWTVRTAKWIATCSTASRRRSNTCCATRSRTASKRRRTPQGGQAERRLGAYPRGARSHRGGDPGQR
jgi:chemosensory pili system protein ChpA (sensor histidine kinase/response regulator)